MIVYITKLYVAAQVALANKKGAAMVEYALLAALIAVVAVGTITSLGTAVNTKFNALVTSI
ncbi:MAG: Flp family type IVb pilin [Alphaproteobacteria bacterium]|nr:MAG: Flp family type IVb pilin [Alphaproteobacteria bacterium]